MSGKGVAISAIDTCIQHVACIQHVMKQSHGGMYPHIVSQHPSMPTWVALRSMEAVNAFRQMQHDRVVAAPSVVCSGSHAAVTKRGTTLIRDNHTQQQQRVHARKEWPGGGLFTAGAATDPLTVGPVQGLHLADVAATTTRVRLTAATPSQ